MTITASVLIPPQVAYNVARRMRGLFAKELTDNTWYKFLKSEHSPIRVATYRVYMENIPAWVSVHFTRHKIGVEHFVTSRREDITGKKRSAQDLVTHEMIINAQAMITMARKRLCRKSAKETLLVMGLIKQAIFEIDRPLSRAMVPDCLYRDGCHEMTPCS